MQRADERHIGNSVTSIGYSAFSGCSNLDSLYINDLAAYLNTSYGSNDSNPMYYATKLYINNMRAVNVVIPDSVIAIPEYAFHGCDSIKSIAIPDSVTSIGYEAFKGCSGLTSVTIPDSVTSIGEHAFYGCSSLTSVTIPDSVTSIGDYTFYKCSGLTSVTIPDSVTSIDNYAFYNCSGLTSVTIPDSVTSIGDYAFSGCSSLTSVTIPDSVTSIGEHAFAYCRGLTSVTIGNSVMSIANSAFYGCSNLNSIVIPITVTEIEKDAFNYCPALRDVEYGGTETDWDEIYIGSGNDYLKNASIRYIDKYPYTLNSISLVTETGKALNAAPQGSAFIAEVSLTKTKGRSATDYLIVAAYNKRGDLLSLDYVKASFIKGTTYSFGFHIPAQTEKIGKIKAYIWNSFSSGEPLAKDKLLSCSGPHNRISKKMAMPFRNRNGIAAKYCIYSFSATKLSISSKGRTAALFRISKNSFAVTTNGSFGKCLIFPVTR